MAAWWEQKKKDGGSTTRKDSLSSNHRAVIEQTKQVMNNMLHEFFFMLLCCVRIGVVPTPKRRRSSDHCVVRAPGLLLDSANCSLMKEGPASVAFLIKTRQNEGGGEMVCGWIGMSSGRSRFQLNRWAFRRRYPASSSNPTKGRK